MIVLGVSWLGMWEWTEVEILVGGSQKEENSGGWPEQPSRCEDVVARQELGWRGRMRVGRVVRCSDLWMGGR